ncbi:MAG: COX15/CtaA family protein [Actinobacteria bacterium]|nr:COX15/CtaA family protein [Actinomycetota bacterium]
MDTVLARTGLREVSPERYLRIAWLSALSLYGVILTGALVRLTGSGLACESWPGCEGGAFFPALGDHSTIEFGNRVFALFPLVLTLVAWVAARRASGLPRWVTWVAALTFLGTLAQAPLGLLTIRLDLHPLMVMTHFLLALVVLAGAVVVAVEALGNARGRVPSPVPPWLRGVGIVLVVACGTLVVTGALSTAAGPHPGDSAEIDRFWNLLDAVYVHVRATAVFGIGFVLLLAYLVRHRARVGLLLPVALGLVGLLLVQMAVGEIQWRNQLPWWLVLIHVVLAAGVWAWTVGLAAALWRTPARLTRA